LSTPAGLGGDGSGGGRQRCQWDTGFGGALRTPPEHLWWAEILRTLDVRGQFLFVILHGGQFVIAQLDDLQEILTVCRERISWAGSLGTKNGHLMHAIRYSQVAQAGLLHSPWSPRT